jgi:hypothetical protein
MYSPGNAPQLGFDLQQLWTELNKIRDTFLTGQMDFIEFTIHNKEPSKIKEARMYYADGTNWNPGSGKGWYGYVDGWVPIATTINTHRPAKATLTLVGFTPTITIP